MLFSPFNERRCVAKTYDRMSYENLRQNVIRKLAAENGRNLRQTLRKLATETCDKMSCQKLETECPVVQLVYRPYIRGGPTRVTRAHPTPRAFGAADGGGSKLSAKMRSVPRVLKRTRGGLRIGRWSPRGTYNGEPLRASTGLWKRSTIIGCSTRSSRAGGDLDKRIGCELASTTITGDGMSGDASWTGRPWSL